MLWICQEYPQMHIKSIIRASLFGTGLELRVERARLANNPICKTESAAVTALVRGYSRHFQLKLVKKPSLLGTPLWTTFTDCIRSCAWLQQVHFPIWIDNICEVSLFPEKLHPLFFFFCFFPHNTLVSKDLTLGHLVLMFLITQIWNNTGGNIVQQIII